MTNQNIKVLATELYQVVNGLSFDMMNKVFPFDTCNTRYKGTFHFRPIKSVNKELKHAILHLKSAVLSF